MKLYKVVPIVGHFAHEINASLARLEHEHGEIHCVTSYSAFVPAPEAERAVRFTAWLRDYMPIGEKTLVALRGKGFVYLAAWLVSLNEQFALAEAEGGGGTDGLAD